MGFPIGPLLIGSFFSSCLFGTIIVQVQHYFEHYTDDSLYMKLTVRDQIPLFPSKNYSVPRLGSGFMDT